MSKKISPENYQFTEGEEIYSGRNSTITEVKHSVGKHEVPLLKKKNLGIASYVDYEFMTGPGWHDALKERGYPVFPTWRYDQKEKVDYITDLRRGGTHRVIDFCGHPENYEKVFVSNLDDLEAEADALLLKLSNDGVVINEPNIFFDIEIATGKAKIILGDLREMGYEWDDEMDKLTNEQILAHDKRIMDEHMKRLKDIITEK